MNELNNIARSVGMHDSYTSCNGEHIPLNQQSRDAILAAMGLPKAVSQNSTIDCRDFESPLKALYFITENSEQHCISFAFPSKQKLSSGNMTFTLNNKNTVATTYHYVPSEQWRITEVSEQPDKSRCMIEIQVPPLQLGYWTIELTIDNHHWESDVAVTPEKCHSLSDTKKQWGIACQIYSLRSQDDWGIGSFTELKSFAEHAAMHGCDTIGINPIHPLYWSAPEHFSPYSPSTRLFINPIYIDIKRVPGFDKNTVAQSLTESDQVKRLRQQSLVDYHQVTELKDAALTSLFADFEHHASQTDHDAFAQFCEDEGQELGHFALFNAMFEHFWSSEAQFGWQQWPDAYRDPEHPEVKKFAVQHQLRIRYYQFLQWIAHCQLSEIQTTCRAHKMKTGLYIDLAVGCHDAGSEVWSQPSQFVLGASVGAPPDPLSAMGQSWGLPPYNPEQMKLTGYRQFRRILAFNMRYGGAIRIDHILGYMRQFWVPPGMKATDGVYMTYPMDELFSLIALESQLNQCVVIGEDLGTVPDGFSDKLRQYGILSYKVLLFERWESGLFKQPKMYESESMVTGSTHDLPTIRSWWEGNDLLWRERLALYPESQMASLEQQARLDDRQMLLDALLFEGVLEQHQSPLQTPPLINQTFNTAVQCYLAMANSQLQMIPLEDLLCLQEQVNIPGTVSEHPNWRRRLPLSVEKLWQSADVKSLVQQVDKIRKQCSF